MKAKARGRRGLGAIFAVPLMLAAIGLVGLAAGLVGDGIWDVLAWVGLGAPVVLLAWLLRPGR